jgi:hypothetical protein
MNCAEHHIFSTPDCSRSAALVILAAEKAPKFAVLPEPIDVLCQVRGDRKPAGI